MSDRAPPLVLLVEDNDADAELAEFALGRAPLPHRLVRVRDGVEALERVFDARKPRPAVILLDLRLPRLGGKEVLRALRGRAETARVPVVVVSSSNETEDISDCYTLGASSFVPKAMNLGAFTKNMSMLLYYWLELNVPPGEAERRRRPAAPEGLAAAILRAGPAAWPPCGCAQGTSVLVVDRDDEARGRTARALAGLVGAPCVAAVRSLEEADRRLARLGCGDRSPGACPRFELLDLDRAEVAAPGTLDAIRTRVRVPLIFFTRNDDAPFLDACYRHLPNSVVRKPASPEDHAETVRFIAHYWLGLNQVVSRSGVPETAAVFAR